MSLILWVVLVLVALLSVVHLWLSLRDVTLLRASLETWKPRKTSQHEEDKARRFEEELLKTRQANIQFGNLFMKHVGFFSVLVSAYGLLEDAGRSSTVKTATAQMLAYVMFSLIDAGILQINTNARFCCLEAGMFIALVLQLGGRMSAEMDQATFIFLEKSTGVGTVLLCLLFLDFRFIPLLFSPLLVSFKQWQVIGLGEVSRSLLLANLASCAMSACIVSGIVYILRAQIWAKLDSDSTSSLLQGCRSVLRGASDGDLLLDGRSYKIVGDASSLERLLKAEKSLTDTSILDLFLDEESRAGFQRFLQAAGDASVPAGLRISLQGSEGDISMDVFCTVCWLAGQNYYLLALKADPEQFIEPPDATGPAFTWGPSVQQVEKAPSSQASSKELVGAFEELVQMSLVVGDTYAMDVEEVTFSFLRSRNSTGMPALRNFVRVSDWQRLEMLFEDLRNQGEESGGQLDSLLFRIPGTRSRYLRAKSVQVSIEDDDEGNARGFCVQLSSFQSAKGRQKEDLESIGEE